MRLITPNFNFNGRCEEAINLYQKAFNAELISCEVVFIDKFGFRWGLMTEQTER